MSVYGRGYRFVGTVRERARPVRQTSDILLVGRSAALGTRAAPSRAGPRRSWSNRGHRRRARHRQDVSRGVAADKASEPGCSAWGYCREHETAPLFWPFVQLLRGSKRAGGSSPAHAAVDAVFAALTRGRSPAGWGGESSGYRLLDGVAGALQKVTDETSCCWCSMISVVGGRSVSPAPRVPRASEIARMPLVILATVRNTEVFPGDGRLRQLLAHRQCEHIELDRPTPADVAEYTEAWLGEPPRARSARPLFETSAGNPFFMVELPAAFRNSGPPRVDELGAHRTGAGHRAASASGAFGPEATTLLSAAAVVGPTKRFRSRVDRLRRRESSTREAFVDTLENARKTSTILSTAGRPGHLRLRARSHLERPARGPVREPARLACTCAPQKSWERATPRGRRHPSDGASVAHFVSALPLGDVLKAVDYTR